MVKYQSPVNYSHISVGFSDRHPALDMGWLLKYKDDKNKSYNQPIYAIGNGKVLFNGNTSDGGKTLVIAHNYNSTHDLWAGYSHNSRHDVKVGDIVKQGDKIANMGETGAPGQPHVHLRTSLIKKGTAFSWSNFNKAKRENPLDWIYEYPHQEVDGIKKLPKDKPKEETNKKLTDKEIAHQILYGDNIWGDGQARKDSLGSRWRNVQNIIEAELAKNNKPKPSNPTPSKPKTEYVTVSGKHNLYINSTGSAKYGKPMQNLAKREMKVLARANGRVRVDTSKLPAFDVNSFWLDLGDKKPTPAKPKKEYVSVGGNHTLYRASTGTGHYGVKVQNLAHRKMEVLERKNGRVRVNAKPFTTRGKRTFDVDSFWVKV